MTDQADTKPRRRRATSGDPAHALLADALRGLTPRAGSFIVTIYGDVVEPRGGRLWIGNIIETCASVGISETLVRTAVSRLVAAGQLAGDREGRRSYYRLTDEAKRQFLAAARVLFEPPDEDGWRFVWLPDPAEESLAALERAGFARLAPGWLVGPTRERAGAIADAQGVVFEAAAGADASALRAFARQTWDLAPHAAAYAEFVTRFAPVAAALASGLRVAPAQALLLRLLLVHQFRHEALRDPRLPADALPEDWPGRDARLLFARLYADLSPGADRHVAEAFVSADGPLPESTPTTARRLDGLARTAGRARR
ncbi:phenylacetic acid degradation operon negative regulatory protein PaaX [Alsobacter sp. SYSU M60028]|uniref:Phenylacetic acid degradation operon negative regulatory protein PaaX n=1 Tax=Alsobacter ponti TaxID=2962936 RepID=A0ABT1LC12_9HYPH|nr:phenylacetic acid degradation operon negative regulatory protein PaaX [Alsobacter ponti]MCP8938496.1 phenylacetic acid degradation operon negative regulatory protein PaaX [Alsobacter ponti]